MRQLTAAIGRLPEAMALVRRHGRPPAVLYFGESPGDDLLATAVLAQWRRVNGTRPWYMTRHPDLFVNNPDVGLTLDYGPELAGALSALGVPRRRLKYHDYDRDDDRSLAPADHIINLMNRSAGLPPADDPAPTLVLTPEEIAPYRARPPYLAVQSSVMSAAMPIRNKEWGADRMQLVVEDLRHRMEIVQVGATSDPALQHVTDLRGRTTIREAAAILSGASAFVGMVGFLMHLARAVGTPSVIVYGGREHPSQSGYPGNLNLFTVMGCAPCWLWNRCPYDRECLQRIRPEDVVAGVDAVLARILHHDDLGHDTGQDSHGSSG